MSDETRNNKNKNFIFLGMKTKKETITKTKIKIQSFTWTKYLSLNDNYAILTPSFPYVLLIGVFIGLVYLLIWQKNLVESIF